MQRVNTIEALDIHEGPWDAHTQDRDVAVTWISAHLIHKPDKLENQEYMLLPCRTNYQSVTFIWNHSHWKVGIYL